MLRSLLTAAVAACALAASTVAPQAQSRVRVGVLECQGNSTSFIIGSVTELGCLFRATSGATHPYRAVIRSLGVDIGITGSVAVAWAVLAPTADIGPHDLAGNYGGVSANAAVGVGGGANVLVGGSGNTIALQPLSVQGQTGLRIAAGISGLELR